MKNILLALIVAAGFAAGPVAAQTASSAPTASFTTKTVDRIHPFGAINVYNVGLQPADVAAWTKTLDAGQRQEVVARCAVIIQNQQNYFAETTNFCQNAAIAIAQNSGGSPSQ
jgi:hypothetical protein